MPRKLVDFGTDACPIHASAVQSIIRCSLRAMLHFLLQPDDQPGQAADTGSAVHAAVHAWHNNGKDAAASIEAMRLASGRYATADLADAADLFLRYAADPRNQGAEIVASERKLRFELEPAPEDPTGKTVVVVGTVDQVRRINGELRIWDLKSSKKPGWHLIMQHVYQLAAYSVGATKALGEPVHPGGVIRVRSYPQTAFYPVSLDLKHALELMNSLRHVVAAVRSGNPIASPHEYCEWCVMRTIDACVPLMERHRSTSFKELEMVR